MKTKTFKLLISSVEFTIASAILFCSKPALAQDDLLKQLRLLFPEQVAQLEKQCLTPNSLRVQLFQNQGEPQRANFTCWAPKVRNGSRTGTWLGILPLSQNDPTFVKPASCSKGDRDCQTNLALMQARYPDELHQAEFACAMKNGSLFFVSTSQEIDVRCSFFATTLYDEKGDGNNYLEQPTGVDVSLMKLPRLGG